MCEAYQEVDPKLWEDKIFPLLGDEWALVTAGTKEKCNTMTVSWGGVGVLWGKPTMTLYIRPQRYTKEFMDKEAFASLSFLGDGMKKELAFCGKESGRNVDKFQETALNPAFQEVEGCAVPFIEGAKLVFVGKKRAVMPMEGQAIPTDVKEKWYPNADYHHLYFYEITHIMKKK